MDRKEMLQPERDTEADNPKGSEKARGMVYQATRKGRKQVDTKEENGGTKKERYTERETEGHHPGGWEKEEGAVGESMREDRKEKVDTKEERPREGSKINIVKGLS
jgi:hypothetical protein